MTDTYIAPQGVNIRDRYIDNRGETSLTSPGSEGGLPLGTDIMWPATCCQRTGREDLAQAVDRTAPERV